MVKPIKKLAPKTAEQRAKEKLAEVSARQEESRSEMLGNKSTWEIPLYLYGAPDHLDAMMKKMHEMEDYLSKHDLRIAVNDEPKSINPFFESVRVLSAMLNPTGATELNIADWMIGVASAAAVRGTLYRMASIYWSGSGNAETDAILESALTDYLQTLDHLKDILSDADADQPGEAH
jgi:hypothetical protein